MKSYYSKQQQGFTLLELLISISVFSIMTFMAYGGLSYVIANSEVSEKSLERLHEIQISMFTIERDLTQLSQRNIRDEYGEQQNYIISDKNLGTLIEFTRNGQRNPAKILRSNLSRVAYKLNEGNLIRLHWPHLDRVQGMSSYENTLISNVSSAEIRFLDSEAKWHSQWPPLNISANKGDEVLSLSAIEFKLSLDDWGEISRLFKASN